MTLSFFKKGRARKSSLCCCTSDKEVATVTILPLAPGLAVLTSEHRHVECMIGYALHKFCIKHSSKRIIINMAPVRSTITPGNNKLDKPILAGIMYN